MHTRNSVSWRRRLAALLAVAVAGLAHLGFAGDAADGSMAPQITFLSKKEAANAIVDEQIEPYFSTLQPMEMAAKTGQPLPDVDLKRQRAICRERYVEAVAAFTDEERETLRWYVRRLHPHLREHYPAFAALPWRFLKVEPHIEGGLPHTRGRCIVFSAPVLHSLGQCRVGMPEPVALIQVGQLLVHEQLHVLQRLHPETFASLYRDEWGFVKAERIEGCAWLERHHLANPDGVDCRWVYPIAGEDGTRYILPLVVFGEGEGLKRMPADFEMLAVRVDPMEGGFRVRQAEDGRPVSRPLMQVPEYRRRFLSSQNIYHPNEAAADLFATMVVFDAFGKSAGFPTVARENLKQRFAPLRIWFHRHLARIDSPPAPYKAPSVLLSSPPFESPRYAFAFDLPRAVPYHPAREKKGPVRGLSGKDAGMPAVRVLFGDDEMMKVNLVRDMYVIGRQEGCEIHIDNLGVSRNHARLMREDDGYRVEDLGSSNGTYVNGQQVQRQALADGDVITLGKFEVIYQTANFDDVPVEDRPATTKGETVVENFDGALNTMSMDGDAIRKRMEEIRSKDTAVQGRGDAPAPRPAPGPYAGAGDAELRARQAEIDMLKRDLGRMRILVVLVGLIAAAAVVAAVVLSQG